MNHKNGKIGHYKFEKTGENKGKMICDTPYPNAFEIGLIEATAWQFADNKLDVSVVIDENELNREEGAESTTFLVEW